MRSLYFSQRWRRILRIATLLCVALVPIYIFLLWVTLPDISDPRALLAAQSSVITDRNGTELYRLHAEEDRTYVESSMIPDHLKAAIVAIEDRRFDDRGCVDVIAIARAVLSFGRTGGASTITRQLARTALRLKRENIMSRKIKELILGCQLESRYGKDELLTLYLNWVPFGPQAYGVEQAAKRYFGKSVKEITLAQSAVLASLPQRPSYFNPYGKHRYTEVSDAALRDILAGRITKAADIRDRDLEIGLLGRSIGTGNTVVAVGGRTDQVLRTMQDQGRITDVQRLQALAELAAMTFTPAREDIRAPHFVLAVRQQVEEMFAIAAEEGVLDQGGLTIETTIDWDLQQAAEDVVAFHREDFAKRFNAWNIALIAADPVTRDVLVYIGNADYSDDEHSGKVDMARAPRQPGSSFKPVVYAAAFERGSSPATPLYDVPTLIGEDEPQNFDGTFKGLMTVREALGASRNVPAAKTFFLAGEEETILDFAERLGAPTPKRRRLEIRSERPDFSYGWPLAIGAAETPLTEMVQAYATIASGGTARALRFIRRITDRHGAVLFAAESDPGEQVLDPRIAAQITSILSDPTVRPNEYWRTVLTIPGTASAAKTGTSNVCLERDDEGACTERRPSDLWTLGYTPALVAGVWIGNADNASLSPKAESLSTAAPLWRDFLSRAQRILENPATEFPNPPGLVTVQISRLSGAMPTDCTPLLLRHPEIFLEERVPTEPDPACARLMVDRVTGLLSSPQCPAEAQEEGNFLVVRSILRERFPEWQRSAEEWANTQMELWNATTDHSGSLLPIPLAPTAVCDPSKTPGRLVKPTVEIASPQDDGRAPYPSFHVKIAHTVGSSVRELTLRLDGKVILRQESAPWGGLVRVPRSVKSDGVHTLEALLTDQYFNEARDTVTFRFGEDRSAPAVRFLLPRGDLTLSSESDLTMRVEAQDHEGGVKYVQFFLDGALLSTKPSDPYEMTYILDHPPGVHLLRAVATDLAGNTAEDVVTLTIIP